MCIRRYSPLRRVAATPPPPLASDSRAPTCILYRLPSPRREPIHPRVHHGVCRALSVHIINIPTAAVARHPLYPPYLPTVALTCPPSAVRVGRTGARRCSSSCNCRRASHYMHDSRVMGPRPPFANIPFPFTIPLTTDNRTTSLSCTNSHLAQEHPRGSSRCNRLT